MHRGMVEPQQEGTRRWRKVVTLDIFLLYASGNRLRRQRSNSKGTTKQVECQQLYHQAHRETAHGHVYVSRPSLANAPSQASGIKQETNGTGRDQRGGTSSQKNTGSEAVERGGGVKTSRCRDKEIRQFRQDPHLDIRESLDSVRGNMRVYSESLDSVRGKWRWCLREMVRSW